MNKMNGTIEPGDLVRPAGKNGPTGRVSSCNFGYEDAPYGVDWPSGYALHTRAELDRVDAVVSYTRTGFWLPTNTGDQKQLWLCSTCGSVVHDRATHDRWHLT